jgi:DNA-directed RNA polymerase specialized sigma24 family protein
VGDQLGESDEAAAGPVVVAHPLSEQVAEREAEMRSRIDEGLRLLSVGEDRHADEADLLRAHIDGLTLAVCLDRLTPAQAVALLEAYLMGYTARPAPGPDEAPAP